MGMAATSTDWTADMVRALPEDGRKHEVIDGVLFVSPAPAWRHQRAVQRLSADLDNWLRPSRVLEVFGAPPDLEFSPRRMVIPDVLVVSRPPRRPPKRVEPSVVLLVVEVLSPGTARTDRHVKRRLYASEGVREYWIVDLDSRLVERWCPNDARPEILTEEIRFQPRANVPEFVLDLEAFFAEVGGDDAEDDAAEEYKSP